jgi:hypothetical protein
MVVIIGVSFTAVTVIINESFADKPSESVIVIENLVQKLT